MQKNLKKHGYQKIIIMIDEQIILLNVGLSIISVDCMGLIMNSYFIIQKPHSPHFS